MRLAVLPGALALHRLDPGAEVPPWDGGSFWSLTRTATETSLVCADEDGAYRALEVEGPLDLALTGVMASLAAPLADAGVPILPIATHDTDYLLVPGAQLDRAVEALRAAGHDVAALEPGPSPGPATGRSVNAQPE